MTEFITKRGSLAEQLEEIETARKLVETEGVRSLGIVCVMKTGELAWVSSHAAEDWMALRGGLLTAAFNAGGGSWSDGLPDVPADEPSEEPETIAPVVPIGTLEQS